LLLFSYLLMSGITTGALYALVALGFVVVHKATGVINFAQGEFFMFAGFIAWMLHVQMGVNYALTFVLSVGFHCTAKVPPRRSCVRFCCSMLISDGMRTRLSSKRPAVLYADGYSAA